MRTVSRELTQRLKEAAWEKETFLFWVCGPGNTWRLSATKISPWLPAPTLDEMLEEVSLEDFVRCYGSSAKHEDWEGGYETYIYYNTVFVERLYNTMRDPDEVAKVWLKTKGGDV